MTIIDRTKAVVTSTIDKSELLKDVESSIQTLHGLYAHGKIPFEVYDQISDLLLQQNTMIDILTIQDTK